MKVPVHIPIFGWSFITEKNVSDVVKTRVEDGARYSPAYSSVSQATVYLTSENNNDNDVTYTVEGYWDEETGE